MKNGGWEMERGKEGKAALQFMVRADRIPPARWSKRLKRVSKKKQGFVSSLPNGRPTDRDSGVQNALLASFRPTIPIEIPLGH